MKNRDVKKKIESDLEEVKPEILQEKCKKQFYFVVRQPFDSYQKGEHIVDLDEIERIEKNRLLSLVMKVNIRN